MKLHRVLLTGFLGVFIMAGSAFAQNISTETSVTTVGSTQFGFEITAGQLETVMQATIGSLTCTARVAGVMTCNGVTDNTSTAFVRVDGMPGSFTDSPIPGVVWAPGEQNFFCGRTGPTNPGGNVCRAAMGHQDDGVNAGGSLDTQTSPAFGAGAARDLVGMINVAVNMGSSNEPGMPNGFMNFTLDPSNGEATIDQFIDHTVSLGDNNMVFQQRDATVGALGNLPAAIGDPIPTLVGFVAGTTQDINPTLIAGDLGMVSRVILDQGAAGIGPGNSFGALTIDVTTRFPGDGLGLSTGGEFVTPGLNTGQDPSAASGFGAEWNGFAFP